MRHRSFGKAAAFLASTMALMAAAPSLADPVRYDVMANGETVGWLVVDRDGQEVAIDYHVDNNGRGPKHREEVTLDADAYPVSWTIKGTSLFGAAIDESFVREGQTVRWVSQADRGEMPVSQGRLYVANDASPYSLALYANALKQAEGQAADAVPGGRISLAAVQDVALDGGRLTGTVYRLTGLNLAPGYVVLDQAGELLGDLGGVIRADLADDAPRLQQLRSELETRRIRDIQARHAQRFDAPVRLRNVRVFDPETGQLSPLSEVTVFENRITTILPESGGAARADAYEIDGQGGTLVPGLHDMHAHNSIQSSLNYLMAGVTSTRDMGNDNARLLQLTQQIEDGELPGPRIVRSGMLEGRSPYSVRTGIVADTLDEAFEALRWYADRGYWQVKIYNSLHPEWVAPVAAEAKRLGMGVTGHVPAFVTPDQALAAGYDEISHINQLMLGWLLEEGEDSRTPLRLTGMARGATLDMDSDRVQRTIEAMAAGNMALDVTAVTLETLMMSRAGEVPPMAAAFIDHMPIGYQRYRRRAFVDINTPEADAAYRGGFAKILETIKRLHDRGITLLPGTDDTLGLTVHREIELFTLAGLTPAEALKAATLTPEVYMGRDENLGRVARGALADFFLIPGDPTQDINAIRNIRLVMKDGVAYQPPHIYPEMGIKPFAEPVVIIPPTQKPDVSDSETPSALFGPEGLDGHHHYH
ncbi:MAG: amidohydrolase family protein [Janthinobacterium lividum]